MPITEPYKIKEGKTELFAVSIRRRNGTSYQVKSEDKQSIIDYRKEFLEAAQKRLLQSQKTMVR